MITNIENIKKRLVKAGLRPTYQRLKIMEYLENHVDEHPTAEIIHAAIIDRIPTMSLTTVYNTLDAFVRQNIVCVITITGTETRYDIIMESHHHFLCKKCGRIFDIDIACPQSVRKTVNEHRIEEIHGYFKGICRDCIAQEGN